MIIALTNWTRAPKTTTNNSQCLAKRGKKPKVQTKVKEIMHYISCQRWLSPLDKLKEKFVRKSETCIYGPGHCSAYACMLEIETLNRELDKSYLIWYFHFWTKTLACHGWSSLWRKSTSLSTTSWGSIRGGPTGEAQWSFCFTQSTTSSAPWVPTAVCALKSPCLSRSYGKEIVCGAPPRSCWARSLTRLAWQFTCSLIMSIAWLKYLQASTSLRSAPVRAKGTRCLASCR